MRVEMEYATRIRGVMIYNAWLQHGNSKLALKYSALLFANHLSLPSWGQIQMGSSLRVRAIDPWETVDQSQSTEASGVSNGKAIIRAVNWISSKDHKQRLVR
jgi:hypothetical protein